MPIDDSEAPGGLPGKGETPPPPETGLPTAALMEAISGDQDQNAGLLAWISEAQRQRDAASAAQSQVTQLQEQLRQCEAQLAQAREALDQAERRHQIDLLLIEADAVDLESTRLLTELAVNQMESKDVRTAVADLRRRKPFLFRGRAGGGRAGPMSAAAGGEGADPIAQLAAEQAASTGDRGALLRYLRARRGE